MCLNFVCTLGVLEILTCSESKVTAAYLSLDCALEGEEPKTPWQAHTLVAHCPGPFLVLSVQGRMQVHKMLYGACPVDFS